MRVLQQMTNTGLNETAGQNNNNEENSEGKGF